MIDRYLDEAKRLADSVVGGDDARAVRQAKRVLAEHQKMKKFISLQGEFNVALDEERWVDAEKILEDQTRVGILNTSLIVRNQATLSFERIDGQHPLERLADAANEEDPKMKRHIMGKSFEPICGAKEESGTNFVDQVHRASCLSCKDELQRVILSLAPQESQE